MKMSLFLAQFCPPGDGIRRPFRPSPLALSELNRNAHCIFLKIFLTDAMENGKV